LLDEDYMKQALRLARRGLGKTSPNPMVGAIIVKSNRIVGKGYHHYFGGKHAEVNALENAREDVNGATMYVNLEPCCHHGKTPPCVDAIIQNNIAEVIVGTLDPHPEMRGKSLKILNRHCIKTRVGVLEEECRSLNEVYLKYMTSGIHFITVKFAQTLDGRIATATGNSQWLSSSASRRLAHRLRTHYDAVMVGIGTVITDDPQLTVRLVRGRNPTRIVLDSRLRVPLEAKVLTNQEAAPTIIATTSKAGNDKLTALRQMGIEVLIVPQDEQGNVALPHLLEALSKRGISSVLVEGGSEIITSLLRLKLADKLVVIVAPKLLGRGIEAVGDLNITEVGQALELSFSRTYHSGEDLVIEAKVNPPYQRRFDSA
jgi:diaminohydroxyphosphoribosylaminopyrimidine deaminase/5-amino-6-(5-phosphoribosylamino)uracil reductase